MPKVVLMLSDVGGRELDFEVAPIVTSSIQLRVRASATSTGWRPFGTPKRRAGSILRQLGQG